MRLTFLLSVAISSVSAVTYAPREDLSSPLGGVADVAAIGREAEWANGPEPDLAVAYELLGGKNDPNELAPRDAHFKSQHGFDDATGDVLPNVLEMDLLVQTVNNDAEQENKKFTCKTIATAGPEQWGHAILYCPDGWVMTGGGMQSNFALFERAHPYWNGFMCDNNHGWGSGYCYARCCQLPGFDAAPDGTAPTEEDLPKPLAAAEAAAAAEKAAAAEGQTTGVAAEAAAEAADEVVSSATSRANRRPATPREHTNSPSIQYMSKATRERTAPWVFMDDQWNRAQAELGTCGVMVETFSNVTNAAMCEDGLRENLIQRFVVHFWPQTEGEWIFDFGADFKKGGVVYVDGELVDDKRDKDVEWGGTFDSDRSKLLSTGWQLFQSHEWHSINVFGIAETDLPSEVRFDFVPAWDRETAEDKAPSQRPVLSLEALEKACLVEPDMPKPPPAKTEEQLEAERKQAAAERRRGLYKTNKISKVGKVEDDAHKAQKNMYAQADSTKDAEPELDVPVEEQQNADMYKKKQAA